ncbi:MAG: hypothetical protein ACREP8_05700 [Candidatus Binatia bacterium]
MEKLPQAAMKLLVERVICYCVTLTRTSNCWNDFEEMRRELHELRALGMDTIVKDLTGSRDRTVLVVPDYCVSV